MNIDSVSDRDELIEALRIGLVGPDNDHVLSHELLPESPTRWYLTGFLVPRGAPEDQRADPQSSDEIDVGGDVESDDATQPDRAAAKKSYLPSSIGLSVLTPSAADEISVQIEWGDYEWQKFETGELGESAKRAEVAGGVRGGFRRIPRSRTIDIHLPASKISSISEIVPDSGGLKVVATSRVISDGTELPTGTRSVSVFLVNDRAADIEHPYRGFVFQTRLKLTSKSAFVPRPNLRGLAGGELVDEWDERVGDLQYRDVFEYAVGHGVSAEADTRNGQCYDVATIWVPQANVERIAPTSITGVEVSMEALAQLVDGTDASAKLMPLVLQYRSWIKAQQTKAASLTGKRAETSRELLTEAERAAGRIESGIQLLSEPHVLHAFRVANAAMAQAARRRDAQGKGMLPAAVARPEWRPFQLGYLLMTLRGIAEPLHPDRETVDLLFFPTGGGKTEAYLGLAAFTMALRRLSNPGIRSAGVSVLMRYTLRLLTLDQLGRAAALMCALELEREKDKQLGEWPFEIGLWVGSAATPNRMGESGYDGPGRDSTAYIRTIRYKQRVDKERPIPLENCPWCGAEFTPDSFRLTPNPKRPFNLELRCVNHECDFSTRRALPIVAVDEPIYRRLPAFLIATVDKFASLPWTGPTGALLGHVERYDKNGFYGSFNPNIGSPIGGNLLGPDLVIQDELHLISGPLGTIAGLYETAIDVLASRKVGDKTIRPKIIASTATVRRADRQIRALFARPNVTVFPPLGVDRRDTFFAHTQSVDLAPARRYVGIAAQGRSLKVVLLRTALVLLSAAQRLFEQEMAGQPKDHVTAVDPYLTLLGYFNSLRELGGSRRIIEDEVRAQLVQYGNRRRMEPEDNFFANRQIDFEVLELTSRVSTSNVAAVKRRLGLPFSKKERVDVALATNMISVGLDIMRLGLMVVLGQPKTSAEYIQATSRVGRDPARPGLVVTLLNIHKPRDRSHYERFSAYHESFYRSVEATSVTPFAPRALDRALSGALVGMARHLNPRMTPPRGAEAVIAERLFLEEVASQFSERARNHDGQMTPVAAQQLADHVRQVCRDLLDAWVRIADQLQKTNGKLQYQKYEESGPQRLLYDFLDPELAELPAIRKRFRANRSMRDVEPSVCLTIKNLNDWDGRF